MEALYEDPTVTGLLGGEGEQGAGRGLAKHSHFISQGSPLLRLPPSLPIMLSQPLCPRSLEAAQRQEPLWLDRTESSAGL